jgi:hypothetical protein
MEFACGLSKLQCSFNFSNSRCYVVNKATGEIRYRVEVSVTREREVKGCRALIVKVICPNQTEIPINHGFAVRALAGQPVASRRYRTWSFTLCRCVVHLRR